MFLHKLLIVATVLTNQQFDDLFKKFLNGYMEVKLSAIFIKRKFKKKYFQGQTTLKIVSLNETNGNRLDLFFKRFGKNPQIGLETWKIRNDPNEMEFHDMGAGSSYPSTINGYMVFVDHIEIFLGFLLKFSKINSNGKWIFIFDKHSLSDVELSLEQAWIRHRMLNILGIVVIGDFEFCVFPGFLTLSL